MWCVVSGVHREVDENCALLGYYAMSSGNLLSTFRNNLLVPSSWVPRPPPQKKRGEVGTDRLPQNVGKKLPILTV